MALAYIYSFSQSVELSSTAAEEEEVVEVEPKVELESGPEPSEPARSAKPNKLKCVYVHKQRNMNNFQHLISYEIGFIIAQPTNQPLFE